MGLILLIILVLLVWGPPPRGRTVAVGDITRAEAWAWF
jgi:hypothetical protein